MTWRNCRCRVYGARGAGRPSACCRPFAVPYKHYSAGVIGECVHKALAQGISPAVQERQDMAVPRQTVAGWVRQFEDCAPGHILQSLPALEPDASVAANGETPAIQAWQGMAAWCARQPGLAPRDDAFPRLLLRHLQPALGALRPALSVFRIPLHSTALGP